MPETVRVPADESLVCVPRSRLAASPRLPTSFGDTARAGGRPQEGGPDEAAATPSHALARGGECGARRLRYRMRTARRFQARRLGERLQAARGRVRVVRARIR